MKPKRIKYRICYIEHKQINNWLVQEYMRNFLGIGGSWASHGCHASKEDAEKAILELIHKKSKCGIWNYDETGRQIDE